MEVKLAAETLFNIGPLPFTNSLLVTLFTTTILSVIAYLVGKNVRMIPSGVQNVVELIIEEGYQMVEDLAQEKTKTFFPMVMTFFLFILAANLLGLLPGFGTIGFYKNPVDQNSFVPFFRSITADLNTTLALALVSAITTHIFSIRFLGIWNYLKRWVSLNPVFLFVGILEMISEVTKIISLSFRLFGNIFAGEVVLTTISGIFAFVAPLPFYFMEVIVGFVQAAVFAMLTLAFMVILAQNHQEE